MSARDFLRNPNAYLRSRGSQAWQLLSHFSELRRKRRPEYSWEQLFAAVTAFADGMFESMQVPSEICCALAEIEKLKPRTVMELGTSRGGTLFLLARAAAEGATIISLDLPARRGGYSNWKQPIYRRFPLHGQRMRLVRADSHHPAAYETVRRLLAGRPLDVLFIDGDHSYAGVKMDYSMYSRLVRPGGLVVFHDIVPNRMGNDFGVDRFWAEIRERFRCREITDCPDRGWGIGILVQ